MSMFGSHFQTFQIGREGKHKVRLVTLVQDGHNLLPVSPAVEDLHLAERGDGVGALDVLRGAGDVGLRRVQGGSQDCCCLLLLLLFIVLLLLLAKVNVGEAAPPSLGGGHNLGGVTLALVGFLVLAEDAE